MTGVTLVENIDGVLGLVHTRCITPTTVFLLIHGTVTLTGIHERRCVLCREWVETEPRARVRS